MVARPNTIPADFWLSMMQHDREALTEIARLSPLPTGSRWFCPWAASKHSDWDVYCLASAETLGEMKGWSRRSQREQTSFPKLQEDGQCLYKGKLNAVVIYPSHIEKYRAFERATNFCKAMRGPDWRDGRVEVFEAFKRNAPIGEVMRANADTLLKALHESIAADYPQFGGALIEVPGIVADFLEEQGDVRCEGLR